MDDDVLALWPDAPIEARSTGGRWLRFERHPHGLVYLQRYAWDEPCMPHYLVVTCRPNDGTRQTKHLTLAAAVAELRRQLEPRLTGPRQRTDSSVTPAIPTAAGGAR